MYGFFLFILCDAATRYSSRTFVVTACGETDGAKNKKGDWFLDNLYITCSQTRGNPYKHE